MSSIKSMHNKNMMWMRNIPKILIQASVEHRFSTTLLKQSGSLSTRHLLDYLFTDNHYFVRLEYNEFATTLLLQIAKLQQSSTCQVK